VSLSSAEVASHIHSRLLTAVPTGENPVALLRAAAKDHVPVIPSLALLTEHSHNPDLSRVPVPSVRSNLSTILQDLQSCEWYSDQITFRKIFEARLPEIGSRWFRMTYTTIQHLIGELSISLSETVQSAMERVRLIKGLYCHQASAINSIMTGRDVVVSTSTASGKSVIYQVCPIVTNIFILPKDLQLPLLQFLEVDNDATAMLIFPTKVSS
jgi:DEAD/DEAH box helicase domain-containing protein